MTRRSYAGSGKRWKNLDTFEDELTYFQRKENYKLLKVNGKPATAGRAPKGGFFRGRGEFGTYMSWIFDPGSHTEFGWERRETAVGQDVCVFRYRVPQASSKMPLQVNEVKITVGFHGLVYADCVTGTVTRIQLEEDTPPDLPVGIVEEFWYGPVLIAGQEFFLPSRIEELGRYRSTVTKIDIEFRDYHKYGAEATVSFEDSGLTSAGGADKKKR